MIYWQGKYYHKVASPYNGEVYAYLLGGRVLFQMPEHTQQAGYLQTPDGVVVLLRRRKSPWLITVVVVSLLLTALVYPRYEYRYYPVCFAECPSMEEGVLYCNVLNEAEQVVTVQFLGEGKSSMVYTLQPKETLPYVSLNFVPDTIRYGGCYDFSLEVSDDGFQ